MPEYLKQLIFAAVLLCFYTATFASDSGQFAGGAACLTSGCTIDAIHGEKVYE